ncbi:hypothetical protein ANANG_G00028440 [Anguilla anguilla]|uniref:THD domain-containing protein n=1 Tax=Anguilla anguilla TaxID=7936 RepID=A0A9D3MR82_ANGAN|nr:hypothetical protein ANANG_G00028440 [Anguilla anguilla]
MPEEGIPYPQVFVVDRQMGVPPTVPVPHRQRTVLLQQILIMLVSLALCGLAVEACFIYRLYNQPSDASMSVKQLGEQESRFLKKVEREGKIHPTERSGIALKPAKPSAHLTEISIPVAPDGILQWGINGDAFSAGVEHKDGSLLLKKEGFYFIYSKVSFEELTCSMFKHTVLMRTPRYSQDLPLMKAKRFSCSNSKQPEDGMLNSYLGGVFHLHVDDSVFVKVENHTLVRHHDTSDNFFGMFMI